MILLGNMEGSNVFVFKELTFQQQIDATINEINKLA